MPIDECFTQVHHFKWDSTCVDRIKKVADIKTKHSFSDEYQLMYNSIANENWKIDINKKEYLVEKLQETSYIEYVDYPHWENVKQQIIKI